MRVLIAPDSWKGSMSAVEACEYIQKGVNRIWPHAECVSLPMADGGEGTAMTLIQATGGTRVPVIVEGPLSQPIEAFYGILPDGHTAVMEMASASGLLLIPQQQRNPLLTSTYGTGQLIRAALDSGATRIIIGIGGSATNDGGAGMAEALGVRFLDENGQPVVKGGGYLDQIHRIDIRGLDRRLTSTEILVACDVDNPLTGFYGASRTYGPQKGADSATVEMLDRNLAHYGMMLERTLGRDFSIIPGSGAAGGLGAGLMAFANAKLQPGIELVMDIVGFWKELHHAHLVITGEGKLDTQTARGKVVAGIGLAAKALGIPVIALAGQITEGTGTLLAGISCALSVSPGVTSLEWMMDHAGILLEQTTAQAICLLDVGIKIGGDGCE